MNSLQDSKLNMYTTVLKQFTDDSSPTLAARKSSVSALSDVIAALNGKVEAIKTMQALQTAATTGITQDKAVVRANLAALSAALAAGVFAYASEVKNNTMKEKVNYSFSDLIHAKDDQLPAIAKVIITTANENLAALGAYEITAASIGLVQDTLDQFQSASPSTRHALGKRVSYRKNLEQLFKETDDLVKNRLDKIMQAMVLSDSNSVANYRSNRLVVSAPTTNTQLKGKIVSADAPKGVRNVAVQLVETGSNIMSNGKGTFSFKELTTGKYTLKLTAEGYQDTLLTQIEIKQGSLNKQEIVMIKKITDIGQTG
ncbi:MAG: carboxypeptidase regulatory-like domain-containing protein [Chitinophagaceae bacterium]